MKKTHLLRNTIIALIICGIAGIIIAVILFNHNSVSVVSAKMEFAFEGAEKGELPNGHEYNLNAMITDEMVESILTDLKLGDQYTARQIIGSLTVAGVYPNNLKERMNSDYTYYPTSYMFSLSSKGLEGISGEQMTALLKGIVQNTQEQIKEQGAYGANIGDSLIDDLSFSGSDYLQQLTILQREIAIYSNGLDGLELSAKGTKEANRILAKLNDLTSNDIEELKNNIIMNGLTKDPEMLLDQYQLEAVLLKNQQKEKQKQLDQLDELIKSYQRSEEIHYAGETTQDTGKEKSNNDIYSDLLIARTETADEIVDIKSRIEEKQMKIYIISGNDHDTNINTDPSDAAIKTATDTKKPSENWAQLEEKIQILKQKTEETIAEINTLIKEHDEAELNDETISVSEVKYSKPTLLSTAFVKKAIMTAGPICALALIVCLIIVTVKRSKEMKAQIK